MILRRSRALKFGTYNVEHGHAVTQHVFMILSRFKREKLDVLAITEAADYVRALDVAAKKAGHHLVWIDGTEAEKSQALLVRGGLNIGPAFSIPMPQIYHAPDGAVRRSQPPLAVRVAGVRFIVVHAPVGAWVLGPRGHTLTGPAARVSSYTDYIGRLIRFVHGHPYSPTVILGDWNATSKERGPHSPDGLRRAIAGKFAWPTKNTGHGRIDGAIVRKCSVSRVSVRPNPAGLPHSDHLLVTGWVTGRPNRRTKEKP